MDRPYGARTPARIVPVGTAALLLEVADPAAWFDLLCRHRGAGRLRVTEIVPGAGTVLLDGLDDPTRTAALIASWSPPPERRAPSPAPVQVPVEYTGADLPFVAAHWGTSRDGVIERLNRTEFRVAFCGFAPGFAYLAGLPPELAVPRLPTPRAAVPTGSVGLAGPYAGIYPGPSPGGWRLVGRTGLTLFDVERDPPALLTPGTQVRLMAAA